LQRGSRQGRKAERGAERAHGEWRNLARDLVRDRPLLTVLGASALIFTAGALVAGGRDRD